MEFRWGLLKHSAIQLDDVCDTLHATTRQQAPREPKGTDKHLTLYAGTATQSSDRARELSSNSVGFAWTSPVSSHVDPGSEFYTIRPSVERGTHFLSAFFVFLLRHRGAFASAFAHCIFI